MDGTGEDVIPLDWAGEVLCETATADEMDEDWTTIFWSDDGAGYADEEDEGS